VSNLFEGQIIKTQIGIAVSVYVLVAIVRKRLGIPVSRYEVLQILSLTMFERVLLNQLLAETVLDEYRHDSANQMIFSRITLGRY
jgi:hypothetical protein